MPQSADKVLDHFELFHQPEYQALLKNKKECFENAYPDIKVKEVAEWTKTWEYREKNFAREALTVNPAKACQPLGAVFAAAGFEGSLSYVHGSQGCVAYFRSHLARHFKEPISSVSDSMTEDAAVFGGLNNIVEGLANSYKMYKPKMIAMSTTCMAEVIGDDLHAFIAGAKEKGSVPADFPVASCHTPSFVGSHITGYDAQVKGVLQAFWEGKTRTEGSNSINIVGGFDGYAVGNIRELKRMMAEMGVEATFLADVSDVFDTPTDGTYRMYDGGTKLDDVAAALDAKATLSLQHYSTIKTLEYAESKGQVTQAFHHPVGVGATDEFLMAVSKLTGKAIPDSLTKERGRLVDAIADSVAHLHGKKFAIFGDPDLCIGLSRFLMELGAEPVHVLATNGNKEWEAKTNEVLASSPYGAGGKAWAGKDLWHMRSLLFTEPVDFLIGSTYGKYLERDTGTPLIRIGFPIFDRHHHHRYPVWGYQGSLNVLVKILDKVFDVMDASTNITGVTDISYDIIR